MKKKKNYTDEDIIKFSAEVKTMAKLLIKLGLKPIGGNFKTIKKRLKLLGLDCEHWTGRAWNEGERTKNWENYTRVGTLKKHLIKDRGHCCEECGLKEWREVLIPLEVHHIDGNSANNHYENLSLLCCNCHALTKNWRSRNFKIKNDIEAGL